MEREKGNGFARKTRKVGMGWDGMGWKHGRKRAMWLLATCVFKPGFWGFFGWLPLEHGWVVSKRLLKLLQEFPLP